MSGEAGEVTTDVQPGQPDAAAAAEGAPSQGASGSDLYQQVLQAIPETLRGTVEPHLKEWDKGVTERFQEAAEFRKQWEPYQELGLNDFQPEQVQELVAFAKIAQDPEAFNDWILREAEARELLEPDDAGAEGVEGFDPDNPDPQAFMSQIQEAVGGLLDERLKPIQERFSSMDEAERVAEGNKVVDTTMAELKAEHGEGVSDEDWAKIEERVLKLALPFAEQGEGPEAIKKGFAEYQEIVSGAEHGLFAQKAAQPETPEQGGRPATGAKPITSFKDAKEAALELARSQ